MKVWLRRRWAAIWRLIGGVSLHVKIMGIALAMIGLLTHKTSRARDRNTSRSCLTTWVFHNGQRQRSTKLDSGEK